MTLDEAIKHYEEKANELAEEAWESRLQLRSNVLECERCAKEHRQLAEWLKELKDLRSLVAYAEDFKLKIPEARLYKKASDEFIRGITKEEE